MSTGAAVALVLLLAVSCSAELAWFRVGYVSAATETQLASAPALSYRGCFGWVADPFCLVVSRAPGPHGAVWLRNFSAAEQLWVTPHGVRAGARPATRGREWALRVSNESVAAPARLSLAAPTHNAKVQAIVDAIHAADIERDVTKLAAFHTRVSVAPEAVEAANWLRAQLEAIGGCVVTLQPFKSGYAPNVLCRREGNNPSVVIMGAHYDSRARNEMSTTERAPGADDNGSGSAALLAVYRAIVASGVTFEHTIMFAWFAGEEQGLYGSEYLAHSLRGKVKAMLNADMLGYVPRGAAANVVYFDRDRVTASVQDLGRQMLPLYLPGVQAGTAVGCCSDGYSFYNTGAATGSVFEYEDVVNPYYHKSSDTPDTVNYEHVRYTIQAHAATFATLAIVAGD